MAVAVAMLPLGVMANSSFDWTGTDGVVHIPDGTAAEVLDEDITVVEALTSIIEDGSTSQIVFKNTTPITLAASITGPGGGGSGCHNVVMDAASQVTFNGKLRFTSANTYFTLANCTVNNEIGGDTNYYYVYACSGCTAVYSSTAKIIRRYIGYFRGPGTHRFASKIPNDSLTFACMNFENGATLVLDADNIVNFPCMFGGDNSAPSKFDLNGHSISLKCIRGGSTDASATPKFTEVTSEEPATLTFNMTAKEAYAEYDQKSSVFYTGALTVNFANGSAFTNRFMNGTSTTTGDLNISGGTVAFDGNATWTGPAVNVTGGRLLAKAVTGSLSLNTDLSVSGSGVIEVPDGSALAARSLSVNGVEILRNDERTIASLAADYPGMFAGGGAIRTFRPYLYVDDANGDDVNNNGRSAASPFKTIKRALQVSAAGDTVCVAPGVYGDEPDDEVMGAAGDWSRVVIPNSVTLKATGSATNTFILGKTATSPITDAKGNALSGTDSARCAYLSTNARIEGFTLTGGCATWDGTTAKTGGGVYAVNSSDCRIVGCIISNCYAATTASAGQSGRYLRCRISDNNKSALTYGYGIRDAKAYNCLFASQTDAVSGCNDILYCTFYMKSGGGRQSHNGYGPIRGCVFMSSDAPNLAQNAKLYNTICVTLPTGSSIVMESCAEKTLGEMSIADTGAPTHKSAVIDFGETWSEYLARMLAAGWTEEEASVDYAGNPRCAGSRLDAGCCEYDADSEVAVDEWFVDDATGSDANDGRNIRRPFKTIKAALTRAVAGDTVHVAEGVYGDEPGDEVMGELKYKAGSSTQLVEPFGFSRIVVPDDVAVEATGRPEKTVILGRKATVVLSGGGCGADSARCAYLRPGTKLVGFTLTGGYSTTLTETASDADGATSGGGFCTPGSTSGTIIGCIVSNNVASATGGASWGGRCFGCRFYDNDAVQAYGKGVRYAYLYNCLIKNSRSISGMASVCYGIVNCTFSCPVEAAVLHSCTSADVINSVFDTVTAVGDIGGHTYYNCLFTTTPGAAAIVDSSCRVVTSAAIGLGAKGELTSKSSAAVGFGSNERYAAAMASYKAYADSDCFGSQRVYNGTLDAGAAEYDWRGDYCADLGRGSWLSVDAALSNVTETAAGAVRLVGGAAMTLMFTVKDVDGQDFVQIPFVQSGAGTLTATLDGEPLEAVDGKFTISATAARRTLVIAYEGDGHVDFTRMKRMCGFKLMFF